MASMGHTFCNVRQLRNVEKLMFCFLFACFFVVVVVVKVGASCKM